jgi:hypothetical protein
VVWVLESLEPRTRKEMVLKVKAKDSPELRSGIEAVLREHKVSHELRAFSPEDLSYLVKLPLSRKTDTITKSLVALGNGDEEQVAVEWSDRKSKDKS